MLSFIFDGGGGDKNRKQMRVQKMAAYLDKELIQKGVTL
jgi:hypothetical protein